MSTAPFKFNGKELETSIKPKYENQLANFNPLPHPDEIHTVLSSSAGNFQIPVHKTQEEIDRMWEYNRMMGRT